METLTYDQLFAGCGPCGSDTGILLSGENRKRGAVLGRITRALGATTPGGANTGDGDVTGEALKKWTQVGSYLLTCITAAVNGGTFSVVAPDGTRLGDAKVGVAYANDHLGFTIADGAADYAAGDTFTIAVAAGSGKLKIVNSANVDGSNVPYAILAADTDASAADKTCPLYKAGEYNSNALTFGGTDTAATHKEALRDLGILLRNSIKA